MKRVLAFILVLSMVLGSVGMVFADSASDIAGHKNEKAILRLNNLGIVEGDDRGFAPDDNITRAEFAVLVVRALGLEGSANVSKGDTAFTDVTVAAGYEWASGAINVATKLGYIQGYGGGLFGPADNIRYEDAITLIVRVLGYEPVVQTKGGYPVGYLVVAEQDLDITDHVDGVVGVPITRGAIFQLLDNALTKPLMIQVGYGDDAKFVVSGQKGTDTEKQTILTDKLGIEEVEGRVTSNFRVGSKFKANEIEITDEDGKTGKYKVSDEFDVDALLGLEITAWEDKDDILFRYEIETDEEDILYDTVVSVDRIEVELAVEDDEFDWADDATVYVNNGLVKARDFAEDIPEDAYGRFVLDEYGDVIFAYLFDFDNLGVVTEIDEDVIEYVDKGAVEDEIDLDDYDDVYIYNPDLSKADVDDIDEDSAIFFWEGKDDDIYIIVKNDIVEGEVDRIREDKIRVDGKEYSRGSVAILTFDEGDKYSEWENMDSIKDFMDEDVMLVLDLRGKVLLVIGDAESTSGDLFGIVTYATKARNATLTIFTDEGKEVDYKAESRTEYQELADLEFIDNEYAILKYKLNSDGEVKDKVNDDDVVEINDEANDRILSVTKSADKKFVESDGKRYYITKDTLVMKALKIKDGDVELKPEIIKTDKLISIGFVDPEEAVVFVGKGSDIDFIVFLNEKFEGAEKDSTYGVVISAPWKSGKNYYAEINVFGEGIGEYKISDRNDFANGYVVSFEINSKDEAVFKGAEGPVGIVKYKDGYLDTKEDDDAEIETYKVDSSAVIYSLKSNGKVDKKIALSKINDYASIEFVLDDSNVLVAAVVSKEAATPPTESDGKLAFDFEVGKDEVVRIDVDGKIKSYTVGATALILDKDDAPIGKDTKIEAGAKVNFVLVEGTDEVDILKFVEYEVD